MSPLLLVRHGNTEFNSALKFQGHSDIKLSYTGYRQAERLRDRLAVEEIDTIYSSDLSRALATAEIISSRHKISIITCPELREINFGELEGLTFEEISQSHPEISQSWANLSHTLKFPGGESFEELNNRVMIFIDRLKEHDSGEKILIVAHGAPLRLLICQLLGIDLRHWWQIRLDLASLSILETYPQGTIVNSLNDISYLKGV